MGIAAWAPHIPTVKDELGLGVGELGIALLGLPLGALAAQPAAGWLAVRAGSRPVVAAGVIAMGACLPLPVLAPGLATLAAALVVLGAATGAVDVSMNVQGSLVERLLGRPILSSLHASYSFGALTGAGHGALAEAAGLDPAVHMALVGVLVAGLGAFCASRLLPAASDAAGGGGEKVFARPTRALLALGAIGFAVALAEGAALDWSAVYLRDSLGAGAGLAGVGFVAFSATWAFTRLFADRLRGRFGSPALLRWGGVLAAAGFGAGLAADSPAGAIVGFAFLGIGIAAAFPLVIAAAGALPERSAGTAIAAVSTTAYTGFLAGPPLIGLIAETSSLTLALALLPLCVLVVALLAPAVRSADAPAAATTMAV